MHSFITLLALAAGAQAHVSAFVEGMYCLNGPDPNNPNANANNMVNPLYQLSQSDWWMQSVSGCLNNPPAENASLALPAGGKFTVELAHNQGQTSLSFGGQFTSEWPDGGKHPQDWHGPGNPPECIQNDGAMHTYNESSATGTAWAISYNSELSDVTMENLVVFSVKHHTPWKRVTTYEVPDDMPECPEGGCYCAWLWVASICGQPNEYMSNFRCHVTGSKSTKKLAKAQPPVWCDDDSKGCQKGAKQMIVWNQLEGNNVNLPDGALPGYNVRLGFYDGAQQHIFED